MSYRYVVTFKIADEEVTKFFNEKDHAEKFAKMVEGKISEFTEMNYRTYYVSKNEDQK
tara:strand:+ start:1469 stop:1642 length:174 start_codon:yes stop_codon:yes gene_type:complete